MLFPGHQTFKPLEPSPALMRETFLAAITERWDDEPVGKCGRMGSDAAEVPRCLASKGVDTQHLTPTPGIPSGRAMVCVDQHGENSIVVIPGANTASTRKHATFPVLNASPVTPAAAALAGLPDVVIVNEHERPLLPGTNNPCVTLGPQERKPPRGPEHNRGALMDSTLN